MKYIKSFLTVVIFLVLLSPLALAWGVWGHQRINRAAVFALPDSMRTFFFNHLDFMTQEAAIPDIRKYTIGDKAEPDRHYIDLELFEMAPDSIPRTWEAAKAKFGEEQLHKNGILPWYMDLMVQKLTDAFKTQRTDQILFLAADLGHYVGDATMPLHTTVNHDGQATGQKGIHAFWESQLPEMFGSSYHFTVENARYIPDVNKEIWTLILNSHLLVDSVLLIEKKLSSNFPQDKIYQTDANGSVIKNKYGQAEHSREYAKAYHDAMHGMVEKQLRIAIGETASLWYTAWVNAGKPDLIKLDAAELTKSNKKQLKKQYKLYKKGELWGLKSMDEF
jgi:hypothetical protein